MNQSQFMRSCLADHIVDVQAMTSLWNRGKIASYIFMGIDVHTAYQRYVSYEIAGFVRDSIAYEKKNKRPGTTREILRTTNGKSSSDGATYGVLLGLVKRHRETGQYVYSATKKGRDFVGGKIAIPASFALIEKIIFAYDKETVSFQEAMGVRSKHPIFNHRRAAGLRAVPRKVVK